MNFVEDRLKALKYISKTKRGYLHDLITNIGNDIIEEFIRVGFIYTGYNSNLSIMKE